MNLKADIQRYLSGEGYYRWGIELLEKIGHDAPETAKLKAHAHDTYAPSWAEQRIEAILYAFFSQQSAVDSRQQITTENQLTTHNSQLTTDEDPAVIAALKEEIKLRLKARADWHAQMKATSRTEEKRKAHCATEIMMLTDELEKRYILLNNWRDNHIMPPLVSTVATASDENAATELAKILSDIETIAPRVSKIKGKLKGTLNDERRAELTQELARKKALLKELRVKKKGI